MKIATRFAVRAAVAACLALSGAAGAAADAEADVDALRTAARIERARPPAPRFERGRFLLQPRVSAVVLSPDGAKLAWLLENGRDREVWWRASGGGHATRLLASTPARGLDWTRDGRWLLLASSRQVFALAVAGQAGSGVATTLGADRDYLGVDPVSPAAAIVRERQGRDAQGRPLSWRLWRVDVRGRRELLHADARRIQGFAFDARGRIAYVQRVEDGALVVHRIEAPGRLREVYRCAELRSCTPLATTPDGRDLWMRGHVADATGKELIGVMRLRADGGTTVSHVDPAGMTDLDAIAFDPATRQPAIAFHHGAAHALDPGTASHLQRLREALPERALRIAIGRGPHARWLIETRADRQQCVRWHLYDPETGAVADLFDDAPQFARTRAQASCLPESALARRIPVRWRAGDGMRLHGLLSLPPGRDARTLPLVVLVHGGPWNHARPDYNGATQFLVNRGYAVFEPNFRGSTGHGRAYMLAAQGDFGNGRVQQDIVEGTRAMLDAGIGDARRVGVVGASFGGYSALLGLTFRSDLFRVGVATVPPPDFAWVLRWLRRNPEALELGGVVPMDEWLRMLSLDPDDPARMARLHAQSPLANATRMNRPLLLIAGGEDRRVGIAGVIEYAARLRLANKDVSLLIDAEAGHGTRDALAREANLYLLETMLHRHLGGAAPTPPDAALRGYLDANLRLCGRGLGEVCVAKPGRSAAG
ncbi:MAG: prolyl oligopeptidase family serine peptidase [Pseudomonadota bacterium]